MRTIDKTTGQRHWLLAIFVLSGFAGLIYQSIWSHYLGLFLGHAAYAQALVLAIFMGGMATGAAWIAYAGQRWRNLIRGYALIEAVIGIFGLLFHWAFTNVAELSYEWLIPSLGAPWAVNLARWLVAALLIIPQTILLGMTFPLMSGGLIRRFPGQSGNLLGGLYFTNSIGAAAGALAAVFLLLPTVGLPGAMIVASILNFLVAGLAWWLARLPEPDIKEVASKNLALEQRLGRSPLLRTVLFGTAISGAASFIYEIVWIRMLSMAVGSTIHAFELMLASFIAGLAFGGLWVRKHADETESPLRLVGWMQICMGVAALFSLFVYANAFGWVGWLMEALNKTDAGYVLFNSGTATIAVLIMLPAAFFAGTTLPLFTVALLKSGYGERSIGRVYAWNTLGSIAGVFVAIHVLIPNIGLKLSLCFAALLDLAIGLILIRLQANDNKSIARFSIALGISAIAFIVFVRVPFDPTKLASGVFRYGKSSIDKDSKIAFYQDGKTASISVVQSPQGTLVIATNGKPDAGIMMPNDKPPMEDEPTMTLAAALPLSMLESPKNVGVIGFGSGLTTHTLLGDKRVRQVDTIEIEAAMVQGARLYGSRVERAYTDPRSRIIIDDAKTYFSGQKAKYDILVSEPSNPWISGVGALFSKEFYQFVPRHINEGGLFVQWIQLYEIDEKLIASILNSLTPSFEDYGAWITNTADLLIVASPKGPLPKADISRLIGNESLKEELVRLGFSQSEHLNFRKVADARMLRGLAQIHGELPQNSDYHPILGLLAPKSRFKNSRADEFLTIPYQTPLLLEALDVRQPLPKHVTPSKLRHFPAELNTWRARALAEELKNGSGIEVAKDVVPSQALAPAILLKNAVMSCSNWDQSRIQRVSARIRDVYDLTTVYLPKDMLEGVWIDPVWQRCKNFPPELGRVLALIEATSKRDYQSMERLGREWFEKPVNDAIIREDFDMVALSSLELAHVHLQEWQRINAIESTIGPNVISTGDYDMQRRLIKAMAAE